MGMTLGVTTFHIRIEALTPSASPLRSASPRQAMSRCFALTYVLILWVASIVGCSGVTEDRTIAWDPNGDRVGFQHGDSGVYVADKDGKSLTNIFVPPASTIATSPPLWSPTGDRLIFSTASPADDSVDESVDDATLEFESWDATPEGRRFFPGSVRYSVWLSQVTEEGEISPPTELFSASCDHAGYVAANLGTAWFRDGQSILFVDQMTPASVSLFEFDLESGEKSRVFPNDVSTLLFELSPDVNLLACATLLKEEEHRVAIWLFDVRTDQWEKIPESEQGLGENESDDPLSSLRNLQVSWSHDGKQLAHIKREAAADHPTGKREALMVFQVDASRSRVWIESESRISDIAFHPTGNQIGFVSTPIDGPSRLGIINSDGDVEYRLPKLNIRQFAGWNNTGDRLALIAPLAQDTQGAETGNWSFVFPPIAQARDQVIIATSDNSTPPETVLSGLRVTFPKWSPTENKLSIWGTFTPTHRSVLGLFTRGSLAPGDPAAVLDQETGQLSWMAINRDEQMQIGHFLLLQDDAEGAQLWYEKSEPEDGEATNIGFLDLLQGSPKIRRASDLVFEAICLRDLGRDEASQAKLQQFRDTFRLVQEGAQNYEEVDELLQFTLPFERSLGIQNFTQTFEHALQQSIIAEVFISLGRYDEAASFFDKSRLAAESRGERLIDTIALSQMKLLSGDHDDFVDLIFEMTGDELRRRDQLRRDTGEEAPDATQEPNTDEIDIALARLVLLPTACEPFLATLHPETLTRHLTTCDALEALELSHDERIAILLFRLGANTVLGNDERVKSATQALENLLSQDSYSDDAATLRSRIHDEAGRLSTTTW